MTWLRVIRFALITAIYSAVVLLLPFDIDIAGMGSAYPWWILFALIIITNCKTPLEAACKTFVFFLISQPLIYIFQAPFSEMGLGLLGYYPPWFLMTLLTFPGAWIGWHIKKPGILSGVILSAMLFMIGVTGYGYFWTGIRFFPDDPISIVSGIFCAAEFLIVLLVLLREKKQRITALICTAVLIAGAAVIEFLVVPQGGMHYERLPDGIRAEDVAEIRIADPKLFRAEIEQPNSEYDPNSYLYVVAKRQDTATEIALYDADGSLLCTYEAVCGHEEEIVSDGSRAITVPFDVKLKED